jgi:hypothetical protein
MSLCLHVRPIAALLAPFDAHAATATSTDRILGSLVGCFGLVTFSDQPSEHTHRHLSGIVHQREERGDEQQ